MPGLHSDTLAGEREEEKKKIAFGTVTVAGEIAQRFKSTGCSSRRPRFNSHHPYGSSHGSVTPVLGDPIPSHIHASKTPIHIKK